MRVIIYAIAVYIFYVLVKRALFSPSSRRAPAAGQGRGGGDGGGESGGFSNAEETVQDPVCKTFIIKSNALSHSDGRGTHYFCSRDCLGKYKNGG